MRKYLSNSINEIKKDPSHFLKYLKILYPVFHNSVFFFRDLQYGIEKFMRQKDIKVSYTESEQMAEELISYFEKEGIFVKIKDAVWKVNYQEFVTQIPGDPFQQKFV